MFDSESNKSISNDFNLYCENREYLGIIGGIFYIGSCFSGLVFPSLADNFGRKKVMIYSLFLGATSIIIIGLTKNIDVLIVGLFISGFFLNGYENICLVYVTEISANRFRNFSSVILMTVWAISQIFFAILAHRVHNWRILILIFIGIPLFISVIPMIYYLDETPRHLVAVNEYEKAREVLKKISLFNLRPPFRFNLLG